MDFFSLKIKEKVLFFLVAILLLFLAYSEAFKNFSAYLLIGFFLWQVITRQLKLTNDIINISIISHLLIVLIGVAFGINTNESMNQVMDVIQIVFLFLFFREAKLNFISYEKILNLLFIGFILTALIGIYDLYFKGYRLNLHSVGSVNRSAVYIMYIFVTSMALMSHYRGKFSSLIFPLAFTISFVSLFLSSSRMAIFSMPIIVILYLLLSKSFGYRLILLITLSLTSILLVLFQTLPNPLILDKISMGFNDISRIQIWYSSLQAWIENNIWLGIGIGNSIFIDVRNFYPDQALTGFIDNPHNVYLDMLLERGILGLASFLAFLAAVFFTRSNDLFGIYLRLIIISLLLMGIANITFRYEFAYLFVILTGSYLNQSIKK